MDSDESPGKAGECRDSGISALTSWKVTYRLVEDIFFLVSLKLTSHGSVNTAERLNKVPGGPCPDEAYHGANREFRYSIPMLTFWGVRKAFAVCTGCLVGYCYISK